METNIANFRFYNSFISYNEDIVVKIEEYNENENNVSINVDFIHGNPKVKKRLIDDKRVAKGCLSKIYRILVMNKDLCELNKILIEDFYEIVSKGIVTIELYNKYINIEMNIEMNNLEKDLLSYNFNPMKFKNITDIKKYYTEYIKDIFYYTASNMKYTLSSSSSTKTNTCKRIINNENKPLKNPYSYNVLAICETEYGIVIETEYCYFVANKYILVEEYIKIHKILFKILEKGKSRNIKIIYLEAKNNLCFDKKHVNYIKSIKQIFFII